MNNIWKILNSNFSILVLGFLLTGVVGAWLTDRFQDASWQRQAEFEAQRRAYEWEREKTFELLRHRLQEGIQSIEKISDNMNRRLYHTERVFEIVRKDAKKPEPKYWDEYSQSVEDWNIKLKYYEEDLQRLVGREFSTEFNDYQSDNYSQVGKCPSSIESIKSIHSKFWCVSKSLRELIACKNCAERKISSIKYQT